MKMSNGLYDVLKAVCTLILPALATLVLTLGQIWGLDWAPSVGATISAVALFIGACIGISSANYHGGE